MSTHAEPPKGRWVVLGAGVAGLTAGCAFLYGLPSLVPTFRHAGYSLAEAGTLVAAPSFGLLCTLVVWGALADRYGERWVIATGLALAGIALLVVAVQPLDGASIAGLVLPLAVGGAGAASVLAASGRIVLGWFDASQRGFAMGVRQTAQPLGVALGAAVLPSLGRHGHRPPFVFLAVCCLATAVLVALLVRDPPPRPAPVTAAATVATAGRSWLPLPYRGSTLWRLHGSAALLIVAQFGVSAFGLVYLVEVHHWEPAVAGRLLALAAVGGAASRLVAGWWSDRVGSRTGPFWVLALIIAAVMAVLGAVSVGSLRDAPVAGAAVLVLASILSVSTNGLSNTAVAERAGSAWAGRALALHNTGQNAVAAAVPPGLALVVDGAGYTPAFLLAGLCAAVAAVVIPRRPD